jgi:hypothetical protein
MPLKTDIILPEPTDFADNPGEYVERLVNDLEDMYEDISDTVNGTFRNNAFVDGSEWIPTLSGSTSAGSFTYTSQYAWVYRQGLLVDVWGAITWSGGTATGNLLINLPYLVTRTSGQTFIGECLTSGITYASGTSAVISALSNTYTANITIFGSGVSSSTLSAPASGTINFHLRYIGVSDE